MADPTVALPNLPGYRVHPVRIAHILVSKCLLVHAVNGQRDHFVIYNAFCAGPRLRQGLLPQAGPDLPQVLACFWPVSTHLVPLSDIQILQKPVLISFHMSCRGYAVVDTPSDSAAAPGPPQAQREAALHAAINDPQLPHAEVQQAVGAASHLPQWVANDRKVCCHIAEHAVD